MLCQPKCWVSMPPKRGPAANEKYTTAEFIPSTLPLFFASICAMRIAMLVPNIMALPIPMKKREVINAAPVVEKLHKSEQAMKIRIPAMNIFLRPSMSASLAQGIWNIAVDSI